MLTRPPLAALGALAAAGAVGPVLANTVPAVVAWPALRRLATPALAGVGDPGHVALTFDDGPDARSTPEFLDELDRLGWRATFFVLGTMARRYPSLAAELVTRGHEVGVHGDAHRSHLRRTPRWVHADVAQAWDTIAEVTGRAPVWFRPPFGAVSAGSLAAARRLGLRTVLWTAWGRDWRPEATAASVVSDLRRRLRPGATILLHDSDCTSAPGSWRSALGALAGLAELAAGDGLAVGPLSEHGIGAWDARGLLSRAEPRRPAPA